MPGADKTRQIVDMAIGMIIGEPVAEPQQPVDAQVLDKPGLNVRAGHAGLRLGLSRQSTVVTALPSPSTSIDAALQHPVTIGDGRSAASAKFRPILWSPA